MLTQKEFMTRIKPWFNPSKGALTVGDFDWMVEQIQDGVAPASGFEQAYPMTLTPAQEVNAVNDEQAPKPSALESLLVAKDIKAHETGIPVNGDNSNKRPIPWGQQIIKTGGAQFLDGILWMEEKIGLKADNVIPCMKFESNLNPQAKNSKSTATGLIQFMEFTAKKLGTTTAALFKMDALTQLNYVFKYFNAYGDDLSSWTLADTYMAILWPSAIGKPDSFKLWASGTSEFKVNAGLDSNHDGLVTKAECAAKIAALGKQGFQDANVLYI